MIGITYDGKIDFAQTGFCPRLMRIARVGAHADNFGPGFFKIIIGFAESSDLRWANESKIKRIEENNNPISFIIRKL